MIGFYALSFTYFQQNRKPEIDEPAIHLEMIGVSKAYQKQGIGSLLLIDALTNITAVAEVAGVMWVFLEAINAKSETYYERMGFSWFNRVKSQMVMPIDKVRRVVKGES